MFQIDVKSAFLNDYIKEEVYVEHLLDFEDLDLTKDDEIVALTELTIEEDVPVEAEDLPRERRWAKHHPASNIIGNPDQGVTMRGRLSFHDNLAFVSLIEPKSIAEALQDESWILTIQDELN